MTPKRENPVSGAFSRGRNSAAGRSGADRHIDALAVVGRDVFQHEVGLPRGRQCPHHKNGGPYIETAIAAGRRDAVAGRGHPDVCAPTRQSTTPPPPRPPSATR